MHITTSICMVSFTLHDWNHMQISSMFVKNIKARYTVWGIYNYTSSQQKSDSNEIINYIAMVSKKYFFISWKCDVLHPEYLGVSHFTARLNAGASCLQQFCYFQPPFIPIQALSVSSTQIMSKTLYLTAVPFYFVPVFWLIILFTLTLIVVFCFVFFVTLSKKPQLSVN